MFNTEYSNLSATVESLINDTIEYQLSVEFVHFNSFTTKKDVVIWYSDSEGDETDYMVMTEKEVAQTTPNSLYKILHDKMKWLEEWIIEG